MNVQPYPCICSRIATWGLSYRYRLDLVVFYDRCFANEFGSMSETRVRAVMDIVECMYSEKDSLETTFEFDDNFPVVPKLDSSWCNENWNDIIDADNELGIRLRKSFRLRSFPIISSKQS